MRFFLFLISAAVCWVSCDRPAATGQNIPVTTAVVVDHQGEDKAVQDSEPPRVIASGQTILTRFQPPGGFERVIYSAGAFGHYLQNFPLKAAGSKVFLYDGREKNRQDVHAAVLDIDVGNRDLQQCADAVIRLRAEYLWKGDRFNDIHFNFTNGFRADYSRWRAGGRIRVQGHDVSWVQRASVSDTYTDFRRYLVMVFSYAGTISLEKELQARDLARIEAGDVFIQSGSPGHAVIVMDKAVDKSTGEVLVLLAQSYMPAQDIHVLVNPANPDLSPWYSISELDNFLITPEWKFSAGNLKGF